MPEQKKPAQAKDPKKYIKFIRSFASAGNSMAMYPPGHPIATKQIKAFFETVTEFLKKEKLISIHKREGVIVINETHLPVSNKAMEKMVKHFNNFKITDIEITQGVSFESVKNFLEIFTHSEESSKMYKSLNEACAKNHISNIKSLQAAYIRVSKDVKDKMGGKTVGELKISKTEMTRLIQYLKGEVDLTDPKELKKYSKILKNPDAITSVIDKVVMDSNNLPEDQRKKMVITALNKLGNYLSSQSTSTRKQKEAIKILSALHKSLMLNSQTFAILGKDKKFKDEVNSTIDQIKRMVQNQAVIAEYTRHKKKLDKLKDKVQDLAPQLLEAEMSAKSISPELKKLLKEIKSLLEKVSKNKLSENDIKRAGDLKNILDNYLKD